MCIRDSACTVAWSARILPPGGATEPMCGFAGASWTDPQHAIDAATLDAMTAVLTHRGPDQSGTWFDANTALGHRQLSIIDLDSGRQPLANEDGSVQVVFNGEIYNYRALRRGLRDAGVLFEGDSDTEVLLQLIERFGVDSALARAQGMFLSLIHI